jgi:hypothetical protein
MSQNNQKSKLDHMPNRNRRSPPREPFTLQCIENGELKVGTFQWVENGEFDKTAEEWLGEVRKNG